nr:hypothetical protein CPGR_00766 [Mycolicibacter nonchromogenicus]
MRQHLAGAAVLGAFRGLLNMVDERPVAVLQLRPAVSAVVIHASFIALRADNLGPARRAGRRQPQPNSCSRSSSIPK